MVLDKVMLIGDKGSTTGLKLYGHVGAVDQNAVANLTSSVYCGNKHA